MVIPLEENRAMWSSKLIPPTPITSIWSAGLFKVLRFRKKANFNSLVYTIHVPVHGFFLTRNVHVPVHLYVHEMNLKCKQKYMHMYMYMFKSICRIHCTLNKVVQQDTWLCAVWYEDTTCSTNYSLPIQWSIITNCWHHHYAICSEFPDLKKAIKTIIIQ